MLVSIEDLISSGDFPETAESLEAARALRQGLQFDPKVMSEIRRYPLAFPKEERRKLLDLEKVLACVVGESITKDSLARLCQQKIWIPRKVPVSINWSRRMFIGGNYSVIEDMRAAYKRSQDYLQTTKAEVGEEKIKEAFKRKHRMSFSVWCQLPTASDAATLSPVNP